MPVIKDDSLIRSINQENFSSFYLLYGEETHLLHKALELLIKKVVDPSFETFNLRQFQGDTVSVLDLREAYESLPMMSRYKCVTVKNWNPDKLSKQDLDAFTDILTHPNPSTVLIFYHTDSEIDPKKNAKTKKIYDIIEKNGTVCEFSKKDRVTLKKIILNRCGQEQISIASDLCDRIIEQCSSQLSVILNETDKLIAYAKDKKVITAQDVDLLCVSSVQNTAFDLSNAILRRQYDAAFSILAKLYDLRMDPLMILGALSMSFVDLYRLKTAQLCGKNAAQVLHDFQYRSKYRIEKLSKDISKFSIEQIRGCLYSLQKADRLLKSSRLDSHIVMDQMLGEMMSISVRKTN